MSDLSSTSYCKDNRNDNGISPIMILLLLFLCGGDNGILGGGCGKNECGCDSGLGGILPILLVFLLGGNVSSLF